MEMRTRLKLVAGAAAACLLFPDALAQHAGKGPRGELRPLTAEEARDLVAGLERFATQTTDGLRITVMPGGRMSVELDERFHSTMMARRAADGRVVTHCAESHEGVEQFLQGIDVHRLAAVPKRNPTAPVLEEK